MRERDEGEGRGMRGGKREEGKNKAMGMRANYMRGGPCFFKIHSNITDK